MSIFQRIVGHLRTRDRQLEQARAEIVRLDRALVSKAESERMAWDEFNAVASDLVHASEMHDKLRAEVERLRCEMGWCAKVLREHVATKDEVADHIDRILARGDGAS